MWWLLTAPRRSAQRVPSPMPVQGTPMTDREKILIALREKPLKVFEIMKRVNIKHQDDCQSLLLKMRDDGAVKFDIHKGDWLAACPPSLGHQPLGEVLSMF